MLRLLSGVKSHGKCYMQLDIVEQEQIGLLYISGFRSSSKLGEGGGRGVWTQPDPKNKGSRSPG